MDADRGTKFCGALSSDAGVLERDEDVCAWKEHGVLSRKDRRPVGGRGRAVFAGEDCGVLWGRHIAGISESRGPDGIAACSNEEGRGGGMRSRGEFSAAGEPFAAEYHPVGISDVVYAGEV